jgi:hypothetical protein
MTKTAHRMADIKTIYTTVTTNRYDNKTKSFKTKQAENSKKKQIKTRSAGEERVEHANTDNSSITATTRQARNRRVHNNDNARDRAQCNSQQHHCYKRGGSH